VKIFLRDRNFDGLIRRHGPTWGAIAAVATIAVVVFFIVRGQQQNRQAIEKGCILLNNKIIESQSQGGQSTGLLIAEILRLAAANGDKDVILKYKKLSQGHPITLATLNCKKVAQHPDSIKAIPQHPAPVSTYTGPH
jgi:hypothetical protein